MQTTNPQIQEAQWTPSEIKIKENYTKAQHKQNCWKPATKRKMLKAAKGKKTHIQQTSQ